jgi:hypothetical protein
MVALDRETPPQLMVLFCRAWCLHELCRRQLPLPERALRLPKPSQQSQRASSKDTLPWPDVQSQLAAFIQRWHATAAALLTGDACGARENGHAVNEAQPGTPAGCKALDSSLADWFDGRLMHLLVSALWQGCRPSLSSAAQQELTELHAAVESAAALFSPGSSATRVFSDLGRDGTAAGSMQAHESATARGDQEQASADAASDVRLLPIKNGLLDAVLGDSSAHRALALLEMDSQEAQRVLSGGATYRADYHYHTGDHRGGGEHVLQLLLVRVGASDSICRGQSCGREQANQHAF